MLVKRQPQCHITTSKLLEDGTFLPCVFGFCCKCCKLKSAIFMKRLSLLRHYKQTSGICISAESNRPTGLARNEIAINLQNANEMTVIIPNSLR